MRILALDVGDKRIGVALSDPLGFSAQPLVTIHREGSLDSVLQQVLSLAKEKGVEQIIVGIPRTLRDNLCSQQTQRVLEFVALLKEKTDLPVIEWDERLSTKAAERQMHQMELSPQQKKERVDQLAACFILEGYLQSLRYR